MFVPYLQCLPSDVHGEGPARVEEGHGQPARRGAGEGGCHVAVTIQEAPQETASQLQGIEEDIQKCRKIRGLGCVTRAVVRA